MTKIYVPETPANAEVLALPDADAPRLFAERELDLLVKDLPLEARLDPGRRRKAPLGLWTTQKLEKIAGKIEAGVLTGESPSGRGFVALAMIDRSMLLGQRDPRSGMVKVFPFPLVAPAFVTAADVASEFDAWEALCDAAPPLHLVDHLGPHDEKEHAPSWAGISLMKANDAGILRKFAIQAMHAFCARHAGARTARALSLVIRSRKIRRDGALDDALVTLSVHDCDADLSREAKEFESEIRSILDGPNAPTPAGRQVILQNEDKNYALELGRQVLGIGSMETATLTAHELIEAADAWRTYTVAAAA